MLDPFRNAYRTSTQTVRRIKVCGITCSDDVDLCARIGVDAIGLLLGREGFAADGRRTNDKVSADRAAALVRATPDQLATVVLLHITSQKEIETVYGAIRSTALQLQGAVAREAVQALKRNLSGEVGIIKTIHVRAEDTATEVIGRAIPYIDCGAVDALLLDSADVARTGGTGKSHDWNISRAVVAAFKGFPVVLAGGLTASNVRDAIVQVHPYAVDVLSGVKLEEGRKDPQKVEAFVAAVRSAPNCFEREV
jgi:phosphoribosylanthranilate isomerase